MVVQHLTQDNFSSEKRTHFLNHIYTTESIFSDFYGTPINIANAVKRDLEGRYQEVVFDGVKFYKFNDKFFDELSITEIKMWISQYDAKEFLHKRTKTSANYGIIKIGQNVSESKIIDHLQNICYNPQFFEYSESPLGINCDNGFVVFSEDLGRFDLSEHHPSQRQTNCIDVDFCVYTNNMLTNAVPEGSYLQKYFAGCFANHSQHLPQIIDLFGELLAAMLFEFATCLTEPKAFILVGEKARNGKSQFLKIIKSLLNSGKIAHVAVDHFHDPFDIINLKEKALNYCDELGNSEGIDSARFKAVISGEAITARALYKDFTTFFPRCLHVFATNQMPTFKGGFDKGNQRRLKVIDFSRRIPDGEIIPHIANLIIEKETQNLVLLALQGIYRLSENRKFTYVPSFDNRLEDYAESSDPFIGWLKDATEFDSGYEFTTQTIYKSYCDWLEKSGHSFKSKIYINKFTERLKGIDEIQYKSTNGKRKFVGLKLNYIKESY